MKKLLLLSILLSVVFTTNIYSKVFPQAFSPDAECRSRVTPMEIFQMIKSAYPNITEDEICECFPCLCCKCGDRMIIKETGNNEPCPPDKLITKICCPDNLPPIIKSWYCCEEEPPCPEDCCEPCDVDKCRAPYQRVIIRFTAPGHFDHNKRQLLYSVIEKHRGKQCCEEYLLQNPIEYNRCSYIDDILIVLCIHPNEINNLINEWNSFGQYYESDIFNGGNIDVPCMCQGK